MNSLQDAASMQEIADLVRLLRQNGDKVLAASSKLALSTALLHNLNDAFALVVDEPEDLESSFQVCKSSNIDVLRDLKFLHDFVQKTLGLKVVQSADDPSACVDVGKFRHLKYLELKKVRVATVKGLQGVRGQLESVVCSGRKGVCSVSQLLASCGGDAGVGFVWESLRHLALPHNALESLDSSLELAPWLQIVDLSHNLIASADELAFLPNLKYVNLGYNKLEAVPAFNKAAMHTLQVLVLKNNYIDNINGLQGFECLTELDLSFNCLTDHAALWPLEKMSALLWVSLEGNPLFYHPKHRALSIKCLHPCLSDSKLVLDRLPLSKSEKQAVSENRAFTIRPEHSASKDLLASFSSSVVSSSFSASVDASGVSELSSKRRSTELTDSVVSNLPRSRKKANVKEAIIADSRSDDKEAQMDSDVLSSSYLETSKDHLETKKQILALRKKFGEDNWLSRHAGTYVQDIMGFSPSSLPTLASTPATQVLDTYGVLETKKEDTKSDAGNSDEGVGDLKENPEAQEEISEAEESGEDGGSAALTLESVSTSAEPPYDPEKETGDLYLVQKKKNDGEMEVLLLVISPDDIKERDQISGKVLYSWSMQSVLSCVLGRSEPVTVNIIFDTTRTDRQNRRYFVDPDEAKRIVTTIGERMKERPILLKVFKCMKCSTHFSQDTEYSTLVTTSISGIKQLKCPTCESTLVIQTDELTTLEGENQSSDAPRDNEANNERSTEPATKSNLQHSESYSSIGSATSLEESRESTPSTNALNKKYESDIEILSNPSQSSIEVLDEASRTHLTPHRKRSSEERRTAMAPSLLTIPDTTPITTGLTESSSSGSLTDSICTAYENKLAKQSNADDKSQSSNSERDAKFAPVTNLTSMLGSLLQSIKIGSNKPVVTKTEEASTFFGSTIQYSYMDFSSVDHRIKLHIVLNIFEHENEELVLLLRADVLMKNTRDAFPGCFVLSTSKVYVLRIDGVEGEDPQRWLHKEVSWTTDRLRSFAPLPFKQGVLIELQQPSKFNEESCTITFLCILQDFQRTSNFLFYITELQLPPSCEVEFSVPERCSALMHGLLRTTENYQEGDAVRLLALFSGALLKHQDVQRRLKLSGLIVTASVLVVLEDNAQWLLPGSEETPTVATEQAMSNLIAIEHNGSSLTLNFLDEVAGQEETWILDFVSSSAAEAVINSVQPPWEELFSVPLQITSSKAQQASDEV